MENPFSFQPGKPVTSIGNIFGTPLAVQGLNWLPANQVLLWALFTWRSIKKHTSWSGWQHLLLGGLKMVVVLGSEWCHNIAHVAAARAVGKPVDAMRLILGMPVLLYDEPEHPSITPRQHIIRSLGGPVCNGVLLLVSKMFQLITRSGSPVREVADAAAGMNTVITFGSLVPVPAFDGGPILKWSLISRGCSPAKTASIITRTNQVVGAGLAGAAAAAIYKRSWLLALIFLSLGALALVDGFGKKRINLRVKNRLDPSKDSKVSQPEACPGLKPYRK
jgi:Zn-dependent protease